MNINHKFYIGYLGDMDNIVNLSYIPIFVSEYCPDWYIGLSYKKFIVPESIKAESYWYRFARRYTSEVLEKLDVKEAVKTLCTLADEISDMPIVLVFNRVKNEFHVDGLVMNWFREVGITCEELA